MWPSLAGGIDIPFGGDAILHQLKNAQIVALARLKTREPKAFIFTRDQALRGDVPARFTVPANDTYLQELRPRPGSNYLLYLKPGAGATLELSMSFYSVQEVPQGQAPVVTEAIKTYLRDMNNKRALKPSLLRLAAARGRRMFNTVPWRP